MIIKTVLKLIGSVLFCFLLSGCANPVRAQQSIDKPTVAFQEKQCMRRGWQRTVLQVGDRFRVLLWKAPSTPSPKGSIIILHGGGGKHYHWCVANARIVKPQVRFSELAVEQGFTVFLLNSTDQVTDNKGLACGKVWDDEVRNRPNIDLPFIEKVIREVIPQKRPNNSSKAIFLTGLSSGGYMTVRAATHFDDLITAFAPVSSGDPYGWHRVCDASLSPRTGVHGLPYDNETGKVINEVNSCQAESYANEKQWESTNPPKKPAFRIFHHEMDSANDRSCSKKVSELLRRHGYSGPPDYVLRGGRRSIRSHLWQDEYSQPILDFFSSHHEGL